MHANESLRIKVTYFVNIFSINLEHFGRQTISPTLSTELSGTRAPGLTNCSSTLGSGFLGRERSSVGSGVIGSPDPDSGSWDNGGLKCVCF